MDNGLGSGTNETVEWNPVEGILTFHINAETVANRVIEVLEGNALAAGLFAARNADGSIGFGAVGFHVSASLAGGVTPFAVWRKLGKGLANAEVVDLVYRPLGEINAGALEGDSLAGGTLGEVLGYLAITGHFENLAKGILDSRDVVYYLALPVFFIFVTLRYMESRKWRG